MPRKFDAIDLFTLLPMITEAVGTIADEVREARSRRSAGGRKVVPQEVVALVDKVHTALRPVAERIVSWVVYDDEIG